MIFEYLELENLTDVIYEALKVAHGKAMTEGKSKHRFRFVGDNEILCKTETEAEGVADFLEDLGFEEVRTGYYDPEVDKRNHEVDSYTGWYYIDWA